MEDDNITTEMKQYRAVGLDTSGERVIKRQKKNDWHEKLGKSDYEGLELIPLRNQGLRKIPKQLKRTRGI